jgi:hypothetical protein
MLLTLLDWDKEVFLYLNGLGTASWDGFWLVVTNKWTSVPLYLCLLGLTLRSFGLKRTLIILLTVALLITVTEYSACAPAMNPDCAMPCDWYSRIAGATMVSILPMPRIQWGLPYFLHVS